MRLVASCVTAFTMFITQVKSTYTRTDIFNRQVVNWMTEICQVGKKSPTLTSLTKEKDNHKHSGSIPRNACVACKTKKVWLSDRHTHTRTDRKTDAGQSDPYMPLCFVCDTKSRPRVGAWMGTLKNPTKCLWRCSKPQAQFLLHQFLHINVQSHTGLKYCGQWRKTTNQLNILDSMLTILHLELE